MRATVSASLSKRLDRLAGVTRSVDRVKRFQLATILGPEILTHEDLCELTDWQYTVLTWPQIMSVEEWNEAAQDSQVQLVVDTSNWLGPEPVVNAPDPAVVTDRYRVQL